MKYLDKNIIRWREKQDFEQSESYRIYQDNRNRSKILKEFAKRHILDKLWWSVLSIEEKERIKISYETTKQNFASRRNKVGQLESSNYWYSYIPNAIEVNGSTWEECIPQWLESIMNIYPESPDIRRDLAIRRIFS